MIDGSAVDQRRPSTLLPPITEERSCGPHSSPIVGSRVFFNTFDLMSAHVKPRISTHFAYPLEPAKGSALRAVPGPRLQISRSRASPRCCPIRGPSRRAALGSRTKSLSALGGFTQRPWQDESIRARRGQKICPASQRALFEPVHRHDRSSTLAKFPANSLLLVEKFPASCSKIPCSVA